jgi:hypothetical protein
VLVLESQLNFVVDVDVVIGTRKNRSYGLHAVQMQREQNVASIRAGGDRLPHKKPAPMRREPEPLAKVYPVTTLLDRVLRSRELRRGEAYSPHGFSATLRRKVKRERVAVAWSCGARVKTHGDVTA